MFKKSSIDDILDSSKTTSSEPLGKDGYLNINIGDGGSVYMKGKIFIGFYFFIKETYSENDWNKIKDAISFHGDFLFHHSYEENLFVRMFKAAEKIIGEDFDLLCEKFGTFYVDYLSRQVDTKEIPLTSVMGRTLVDYIRTENSLSEITFGIKLFPLTYFKRIDETLRIKFVDNRAEIFGPIFRGYIKAIANTIFNIEPQVESISKVSINSNNRTLSFIILVHSLDSKMSLKIFPNDLPKRNPNIEHEGNEEGGEITDTIVDLKKSSVTLDTFTEHFPYILVLDQKLNIIKHGSFYRQIIPHIDLEILKFYDTFTMLQPNIVKYTFKEITKFSGFSFLFIPRREYNSNIFLKGIFLENHINGQLCLIFVGGLRTLSINKMFKMGICLSDYPSYDENKCCVFKYDRYIKALQNNAINEESYLELYRLIGQINIEKNIRDSLLYNVVPPKIAELLKQGKPSEPSLYKNTFVMFTGIYNFKRLCEYLRPIELAKLVNDLYLLFDLVVKEQKNVIKIETVADKYLITSGLDATVPANVLSVIECAFEMIDVAKLIKINNIPLMLTCGIHVGDIVAGVIGNKLPRYCIFGSTVNIASRTETTCVPGVANITENVYNHLLASCGCEELFMKKRGSVVMKGIEEPVSTYLISRSKRELIEEIDSSKIDSLVNQCSVTRKQSHSERQVQLNVQTPIPRKITNIFGLKHQFTIDQIETYIKKRLQRVRNKPKFA